MRTDTKSYIHLPYIVVVIGFQSDIGSGRQVAIQN